MKKFNKILVSVFLLSGVFSFTSFGQTVCMVTADFENAENYIVIWEKPADITGIDSVLIYRKVAGETDFTLVGSRSMQNEFSFFLDEGSSTVISSYYRIAYLYDNTNVSPPSPWHHPIVLDYEDGLLIWSLYEKEGQVDETWVSGYECLRDEVGLGLYSSMGYWGTSAGATQTQWFDNDAQFNQNFIYQVISDLPSCDITKANINTSRSNIKNQSSNAEAGVNELALNVNFALSPNPAHDKIRIEIEEKFVGSDFVISNSAGQIMNSGQLLLNDQQLNVDQLEPGAYFLTIHFDGKNFSRTFIKN